MLGAGGARLRTLLWEAPDPRGRVVVVHGLGEHAGRYDVLARPLAARGYSVLAYDQRGHGASEGRRGHVADFGLFVEDLQRVLDEADRIRSGWEAPFLLGHSMGALVLLRYLQSVPAARPGAILSAPWLATLRPVPPWKRLLARVLSRVAPGLALPEPIPPEDLTRDPDEAGAYAQDPLVHHRITAALFDAVERAQERALVEAVEPPVPMLVLVPGDDRVVDGERTLLWARAVGSSVEVMELAGGRHEPFHDLGREDVFERIADWLDARRGGASGGEPGGNPRVSSPPDDTR
ncbi:MAG: lysophospholipase [Gemmatimonadetes bacterium]|nr:lysophospholipase [Gemmatimonadota bacterium]